jgi:exonuclease SbcC
MSYREEQTLLFDGAPLWVLTGPNGAGKSAIFDAITFALYGKYRGGSQNARDLINHGADALTVEFDFLVDGSLHRARRVVRQRGQPTREACRLIALADSDRPRVEPIPGTDSDRGFDEWVEHTIGLTYEAFTSSVLLLQGRSEKLLDAKPRERYSILAELLDLSPYQRLAGVADKRRNDYESQARLLAQQLREIPVVDEQALALAQDKADSAADNWDRAKAKVEELMERVGQAREWERLRSELGKLQAQVEKAHRLLDRAGEIRKGLGRWRELEQVVPILERIFEQYQRFTATASLIAEVETQIEKDKDDITDALAIAGELEARSQELQSAVRGLENEGTELMRRVAELAPLVTRLERVEETEAEVARLKASLAEFPADLQQRLGDAEARDSELAEVGQALPWLRQVAESRSSLAEAAVQLRQAIKESGALLAALSKAQAEHLRLDSEAVDVRQEETRLAHEVTRAETACGEAHERLASFRRAAAQPTCTLCGQPITPEHAQQEVTRLTALVEGAEKKAKGTREEHQRAKCHLEEIEANLGIESSHLQTLGESEKANRRAQQQAERDIADHAKRLSQAYLNLPPGLRVLVAEEPASEPLGWLHSTYPTDADLRRLTMESNSRPMHSRRLQELRRQTGEWHRVNGQLQQGQRTLEEDLRLCRVGEAQHARRECTELAKRRANLESELQLRRPALADAQTALTESCAGIEETRGRLTQDHLQLASAKAKQGEIAHSIEVALARVPSGWKEQARLVDADRLEKLRLEQAELSGYESLATELERASQATPEWEKESKELEDRIGSIPDVARRASGEVERELGIARGASVAADSERRRAQAALDRLRDQFRRRKDQEEAHRNADRQHHLYKALASLLGPRGLQLHLLRRAESSIVDLANETLDGVSRGRMRLELRGSDGQDGERSDEALDLVVYNYDTGTKPMPISLASGSQRFRIAVSLALAIGRYAGQEARHIESVIIDEGFGSLDKNARDDMIQELNGLQRQLARVILVSHQEEFAGAFASGYAISLEDNASRVTLLEPT